MVKARVQYCAAKGGYVTDGWTSAAGNTYGQFLFVSPQIAIVCDFGIGYAYTFVNGIKVLRFNGHSAELVDSRYYHCQFYNEGFIRRESEQMVAEFLKGQLLLSGAHVSQGDVNEWASRLIGEAVNYSKALNA